MILDIGGVADALAARASPAGDVDLVARFRLVAETFRAGEPRIALEILLSNVDEFDVPLRTDEYAHLEEAGKALGLRARDWEDVSRLVVRDPRLSQGTGGLRRCPQSGIH